MTTTPDIDAQRLDAFAAELHRLAELIAEGAVPVPTITPTISWYLRGGDAPVQAQILARALAPKWGANPYGSKDGKYLSAVANVSGIGYDVTVVKPDEDEAPQPSPSVAFAAELNAFAAETQRAQLEIVEGQA